MYHSTGKNSGFLQICVKVLKFPAYVAGEDVAVILSPFPSHLTPIFFHCHFLQLLCCKQLFLSFLSFPLLPFPYFSHFRSDTDLFPSKV